LSVKLEPTAEALLGRYLEELQRWGVRTNLVGSLAPEALRVHLEDSLAAADAVPPGARVVDLGSGAGFPGVPLAIAREDLQIVLVEIRERRVHFLRHVKRTLALNCEVWRRSVEEPPEEGFEVVLLRALAPPERALPLAAEWVHSGGELWLWTRLARLPSGFDEVGSVYLAGRGRIARLRVAGVPRGTL
jgi:16S rRNA (guanine527-N7)-methyltransferase